MKVIVRDATGARMPAPRRYQADLGKPAAIIVHHPDVQTYPS